MPTLIDAKMSQDDPSTKRKRLDLTVTQVVASAFAAVTATIGASFLGVAGTIIGAAVASVLTVVANAIYVDSLHRTRDRLAGLVPPAPSPRAIPWPGARDNPWWRKVRGRPIPWRAVAIGAVAVFAVLVGLITVVEAAAGRPLTDLLRNQPGHGTSFLGGDSGGGGTGTPTHAPSASVTTSPQAPASSPVTGTPNTPSAVPSSSSAPAASASTVPSSSPAQGTGAPAPQGATASHRPG